MMHIHSNPSDENAINTDFRHMSALMRPPLITTTTTAGYELYAESPCMYPRLSGDLEV